jgi:hypothetical protein
MNFSEMNKEQKQLVILGVMAVITTISVLSNMVIGPAREDAAAARETINNLKGKVSTGDAILIRDTRNIREIQEFSTEVHAIASRHLPPETSAYIWAVEKLSLISEELDMVIKVRQHPSARYIPVARQSPLNEKGEPIDAEPVMDTIPMWIPYAVDVETNTSFAKMQRYLDLLHQRIPYASVSQIRISARPEDPEKHLISIIVGWPSFRYPEDAEWIESERKETSK